VDEKQWSRVATCARLSPIRSVPTTVYHNVLLVRGERHISPMPWTDSRIN